MGRHSRFTAALLVFLFVLRAFESFLSHKLRPHAATARSTAVTDRVTPTRYFSQIRTASTNPFEILDVDNWLSQSPRLRGSALTDAAEQQGFDPAFIALVNFPQVLEMMAQHIDDYAAIGEAFSNNQAAVADSIPRLRTGVRGRISA